VDELRLVLIWNDGAGEHVETRDSQGQRLPYRLPDVRPTGAKKAPAAMRHTRPSPR
jgi:hypothetical protein